MIKKSTLLLSVVFLFLLGCNKADDIEPATIIGTWQLSTITFNINGQTFTTTAASLEENDFKDEQWIFDGNNKLQIMPADIAFDYTFSADGKLVIDDEGDLYNYTTEITPADLKINSKTLDFVANDENFYENDIEASEIAFLALFLLEDQQDKLEQIGDIKTINLTYQFIKLQ